MGSNRTFCTYELKILMVNGQYEIKQLYSELLTDDPYLFRLYTQVECDFT